MWQFSNRSLKAMDGIHADLKKVVYGALRVSEIDFAVTEGLRSIERQRGLFAAGATRTMNSRHLTGHAVDLAAVIDGQIRWDWPLYEKLAKAMFAAAKELDIPIIWGGHWAQFRDGPHFELDRQVYK